MMPQPITTEIHNRHGLKMLAYFRENPIKTSKLAIIQHGYTGSADEPHILAFAEAFLENGYNILTFDCTHSFNAAEGELENATLETHKADLEDLIKWAKNQPFYTEPYALAGHSLGGMAVALYAEEHPKEIERLVPAAALLNGTLRKEAYHTYRPQELAEIQEKGYVLVTSERHGKTYSGKKTRESFEAICQHDVLTNAHKLTMPVLLLVGERDRSCPPEHQQKLAESVAGPVEMHIIPGVGHTYRPRESELTRLTTLWLQKKD